MSKAWTYPNPTKLSSTMIQVFSQVFSGCCNLNIQLSMSRRLVAEPICLNPFQANECIFFFILDCKTVGCTDSYSLRKPKALAAKRKSSAEFPDGYCGPLLHTSVKIRQGISVKQSENQKGKMKRKVILEPKARSEDKNLYNHLLGRHVLTL